MFSIYKVAGHKLVVNTTPGRPAVAQKGRFQAYLNKRTRDEARQQEHLCKTRAGRALMLTFFTILLRDLAPTPLG